MIRACLFDIGNVLFFFSHDRMVEQVASLCNKSIAETKSWLMESDQMINFELGHTSESMVHQTMEQWSGKDLSLADLRQAVADIFQPNLGLIPILERLKKNHVRLILLSNTNETHYQFLREKFALLDFFDDAALSFEVHSMKPESKIYQAAIDKAGCSAGSCFYTDDIHQNIEAARVLGIPAEVFTDNQSLNDHLHRYEVL